MSKGKFIEGIEKTYPEHEKAFLESRFLVLRVLYKGYRYFRGLVSKIFIFLIRFYQICISPLFPPVCRYTPTCSAYALEAIKKYGPAKGFYLAVKRIIRCNPFHEGGYDPVP